MSPERLKKEKIDYRSDIYSLGILLYELFSGQPPFTGDTPEKIIESHLSDQPQAVSAFNPDIPANVERIIYQCLEKEKNLRPENCHKVADALEEVLVQNQIRDLPNLPNVYTSNFLHICMQLLENPVWIWCFFPLLSIFLLFFIVMIVGKSFF